MNRKQLVIRDDSIVYQEKDLNNSLSLKNEPGQAMSLYKKNNSCSLSKIELKKKVGSREEFRRPVTKEKVIDEDHYLSVLEAIIQRDYFPDLYKLNEKKVILFSSSLYLKI
jgi:hypothetical protein